MRKFISAMLAAILLATPSLVSAKKVKTPEQIYQQHSSRDVIIDLQVEFDENGHMKPPRNMTRTEAMMTADIERYCLGKTRAALTGQAGSVIKKSVVGGILTGLATAVGAVLGFPGAGVFKSYLQYGGAAGAGSGAFTAYISIDQAFSVVNSYCQLTQVAGLKDAGDRRLKLIRIYPAIGLSGKRLGVDENMVSDERGLPVSAAQAASRTTATYDNSAGPKILPSEDDDAASGTTNPVIM